MLESLTKTLTSLFGKKPGDLRAYQARIDAINSEFEKLQGLSHQELRDRTLEFRSRIAEELQDIDAEMAEIRQASEDPALSPAQKEDQYRRLDNLKKERNKELEKVLEKLLPEAFATVKEAARRFASKMEVRLSATERDRLQATRRDYLRIEGDDAVFNHEWTAGGGKVSWDMVHYDVQLIGGMILHSGKIAEMATGEGKTLVSTLPAYLNALAGEGVHIVTVNDYLARRDSEWMGPLYEFLGIQVDCIEYWQPNSPERKEAYRADIVYGTNNEFGFDYLRDNMARAPEDIVQRGHHYAMVDEVDSVLIDDARTPLIISGPTARGDQQLFSEMKPAVEKLMNAQKAYVTKALSQAREMLSRREQLSKEEEKEAGKLLLRAYRGLPKNKAVIKLLSEPGVRTFLQQTENFYMQEQSKHMHLIDQELFFVIDEKNNSTDLTDKGTELITGAGMDADFFIMPDVGSRLADIDNSNLSPKERLEKKEELMQDYSVKAERIHTINQLLKAYTLFERDVEYIIANGKIKIVDEQTGRVMEGRRYSDGLHQAIEAKENVRVEAATQTYATITLQNYFRMYHKLCGMTGTAETEAGEFWQIYKLEVVVIPTNRPIVRDDRQDKVYKTKREKYAAVIEEIEALTNAGRPVLVGTTSVEVSELLSRMLRGSNIRHNVLNAKQHQREAEIVAEAGTAGTVTIATNMAGRGTDIKLGPGVKDAGGLAIVGTERHESRRVDRQLRGRAGRQGDPGSSQFYVSLDDDLMRLFGSERIARTMDRFGYKEGEVIQHSLITKSIERAQKKVEQNNFGIRKRLLEYDDVMNSQREVIYKRRRNALYGDRLAVDLDHMLQDSVEDLVQQHFAQQDFEELQLDVLRVFAAEVPFSRDQFANSRVEDLAQALYEHLSQHYSNKSRHIAEQAFPVVHNVFQEQGARVANIVVPFSDGHRMLNVLTPLREAVESQGTEIIRNFEKSVSLAMLDDAWKEHLRELDDLRQSVQNAVYEQKDPLLIYKFESFKLFEAMLGKVNRDLMSMLFKGHIHAEAGAPPVSEAQAQRPQRQPALKQSRGDMYQTSSTGDIPQRPAHQQGAPDMPPPPRPEPVRVGEKIGRNDPCPCGSGKKFKNCHGKDNV